MYIPITAAALALLTVAMFFLRLYWSRVPSRWRFFLIRVAIAVIILHAAIVVTKWNTTSDWLNVLINWLAIAGYMLLVLLFSRMSPRWLTIPSAAILLIPLFAATMLIPLTRIFEPVGGKYMPIGDHLSYQVHPWPDTGGGKAGVDVLIYYRPPFVPFLHHKLQTIPFTDQECNSSEASAIAFPAKKTVLGRCPYWPSQPPGTAGTLDKLLPLP